ncbi:DNA-directed RNA polymerase [Naviculisporaceae sp. PSN 640]
MADAGSEALKMGVFKDLLYDAISDFGSDTRLFTQNDLLDLNVIPNRDATLLLKVVQALTSAKLLIGTTTADGLAWRRRSREEAKKYLSLPNDDTMLVYSVIDEAGADGIWNRTIKNRLNMHESVVKNCIKFLETKGYIAPMKSVEHPNKKMYIRANLRPSERATGGPWFTDGELDTPFVIGLQELIFDYIKQQSAYLSNHVPMGGGATRAPKKVVRGTAPSANATATTSADSSSVPRGTKRPAAEITNDDGLQNSPPRPATTTNSAPAAPHNPRPTKKIFLPLPAGYKSYPTVTEIAQVIAKAGVTNSTILSEADIQLVVDTLTYDGLVEPIKVDGRKGYRVTRAVKQDPVPLAKRNEGRTDLPPLIPGPPPVSNGLTEVPCGACPVFDICEEGGPVSPSTCVYIPRWLGIEQAVAKPAAAPAPNGPATAS